MNDGVRGRTSLPGSSQLWLAAGRGLAQLFRSAQDSELMRVAGGSLALTGLPAPDLNCGVVLTRDDPEAAGASNMSWLPVWPPPTRAPS